MASSTPSPPLGSLSSRRKGVLSSLWKNRLVRLIGILIVAGGISHVFTGGGEDPTNPAGQPLKFVYDWTKNWPAWTGMFEIKKPIGKFHPLFPPARVIEKEADLVLEKVNILREKRFFRIFKVDLGKACPFWARHDLCVSPTGACSVCECTEDQIPLPFLEHPVEHFVDRRFTDDKDAADLIKWVDAQDTAANSAEDEFLAAISGRDLGGKESYIDLAMNPPGFTEYKGRNIWGLIYKENCLQVKRGKTDAAATRLIDGTTTVEECQLLEEDLFSRMISGLQTTILVLASEYTKPLWTQWGVPLSAPTYSLASATEEFRQAPRHWYNLDLFKNRIAFSREWMENLYIDFSLLLRTLHAVEGVVSTCGCYTGTELEDQQARTGLLDLLETVSSMESAQLTSPIFLLNHDHAIDQLKNISRIFDCVECEKCRLHGKVKLSALQVAVKAAGTTPVQALERNEITALINALGYFADAIQIVQKFERRAHGLRHGMMLGVVLSLGVLGSLGGYAYCCYLDSVAVKQALETAREKDTLEAASTSSSNEVVAAPPSGPETTVTTRGRRRGGVAQSRRG